MVLYQYLLAKGGERLRPDASAKVFYLAIALAFIVASHGFAFGRDIIDTLQLPDYRWPAFVSTGN